MTFSEKLHGESKMQRQNIRVTISRLQKLQKAYYDNMLGVNDPITDQYNQLFNLLKDAGGAVSPWGKLSRKGSIDRRAKTGRFSYSSSKQGSNLDPRVLQAMKIGTLLNIQKTFSFKDSSQKSTPMQFTSGINTPTKIHLLSTEEQQKLNPQLQEKANKQQKSRSKTRNDKDILMKELGITEEQYNRRQSQLDQNQKHNSMEVGAYIRAEAPKNAFQNKYTKKYIYPEFQKGADAFMDQFIQDQAIKQLVPSTVQPSTIFHSNNNQFSELQNFVKKLTQRINNQNVVDRGILAKREEYLKKLQHPITMTPQQIEQHTIQHQNKKFSYRGAIGSNHFSRMSMLSRSRYSNASSSSYLGSYHQHPHLHQHQIPMPNFKEYISKLKALNEQNKGGLGQVFAGTSFVSEIQEVNTTGLLRNVLAQALEKVLDMSQINATQWLSQFKIEYVNLQIMREEFAKKELVSILNIQEGQGNQVAGNQDDTINTSQFKRRILLSHSTMSNDLKSIERLSEKQQQEMTQTDDDILSMDNQS